MNLYKNKGITYAQCILESLLNYAEVDGLTAFVETFYNCREQGYMVKVENERGTKKIYMWFYAHRNSDEPTITWSYERTSFDNMYDEESWTERTETYTSTDEVVIKANDLIKELFKGDK